MPLENSKSGSVRGTFSSHICSHNKGLTHHDFPGLLHLLEGTLGFDLGPLHALAGLSKFGLLVRILALQGLTFLHCILELLLDLTNPGLMLFSGGFFIYRSLLGLGQRLFEGLYLSRRP